MNESQAQKRAEELAIEKYGKPGRFCGGGTDNAHERFKEIYLAAWHDQQKVIEKLANALRIAANQLEGIGIAFERHGLDLDEEFFIHAAKEQSRAAREALKQWKEGGNG